ncbi:MULTISPECIES: type II CAAX endopeptidase family protein [unclassified Streptomyces]|uniref:CPBP family intramembrane glutamic endopeptidase n=1 Tax=unclassified Streptomyces TaxID=2593676 RepID=UPI002E14DA90|nr:MULTISPECIES: type II CAAX endopeptidase family protein [unclassified Streptomyces]WSR29285.1 CPBP family intramembrane metalloprotease [Streptomyces sp. NBC_01205]
MASAMSEMPEPDRAQNFAPGTPPSGGSLWTYSSWPGQHGSALNPDGPRPGPVPAPSGTEYHEQARNGRQRWPRRLGEALAVFGLLVTGFVVAIGVSMQVAAVVGLDLAPDGSTRLLVNPLADEAVGLLALATGIPAVLLAVRWCGDRPAGTVAAVTGGVRWAWFGICAGVAFPLMALELGVLALWSWMEEGDEVFEGDAPGLGKFLFGLVLLAVLISFQAAAEEFVFRGWIAQFFGGFLRSPWPGVCVGSVLFALAHGFGSWSGFLLLLYSALWWGWLVIRTGGLEAVIAMHAANNILSYGLAMALGQLAETGTAADAPWEALVLELVSAPAYCLLMARLSSARGVASRRPEGLGLRSGRAS